MDWFKINDSKCECLTIEWLTKSNGSLMNGSANSLQSRRNFGERVLNNFMTQIVAAILILTAAEGWGEKQIKRGIGVGE